MHPAPDFESLTEISDFEHLDVLSLAKLGLVCRACRKVAEDPALWRMQLERELRPMAVAFFDGELPPPAAGVSWRHHYFHLRRSWKALAQERTGRLLIQVCTCPVARLF